MVNFVFYSKFPNFCAVAIVPRKLTKSFVPESITLFFFPRKPVMLCEQLYFHLQTVQKKKARALVFKNELVS